MGFSDALQVILRHEGGYVNNPKDPGGETNMGISKRAYPNEDIKNMTVQRAGEIYKKDYWDKCSCDQLTYPVAIMVFDSAVNSGVNRAILWLQRAANACGASLVVDGAIGQKTISACNDIDPSELVKSYASIRNSFFEKLPTFAIFGKGWERRVADTYKIATDYINNQVTA